MNDTKEKKAKLQVTISVLVLTVLVLVEMYLMINMRDAYLAITLLAIGALGAVYVLSNALMELSAEKEAKRQEHYENIFKSEKASYIMLKKSFDEIEEKLNILQENQQMPAQEIINAQKGIAKVIINRSKENADAIINSNDQVLERLDEVEETQNTKFTNLSKDQRLKLSDLSSQTDLKLQDLLMQLKDTELRLNQAIMHGTKVVIPAGTPSYTQAPQQAMPTTTPFAEPVLDSPVAVEDIFTEEPVLDELFAEEPAVEAISALDDIFATESVEETSIMEEVFPEEETISESVIDEILPEEEFSPEPVEEELPPMPDLSDPNKQMSADDIAALFANMAGDTAPVEEPAPESVIEEVIPEPVVEEVPPMPDLSDPNKQMSADEIAALFANMAGADASEEETAAIEEEIASVEEKPAMPDLSDPNKVMSPDEIAALIANL